jgi:hypothetical protein
VNGERRAWYLYILCQGLPEMAGPMEEGGIRYWAVQSGGGGTKEACLVTVRLLCIFRLSRFSFSLTFDNTTFLVLVLKSFCTVRF